MSDVAAASAASPAAPASPAPAAPAAASPAAPAPEKKEKHVKKADAGEKKKRPRKHRDRDDASSDQLSSGNPDDDDEDIARREKPRRSEVDPEERRKVLDAEQTKALDRAAKLHAAQKEGRVPEVDAEADVQSLEAVKADPADLVAEQLPSDVYSAFSKLQHFSRDLNIQMASPEIVLIGQKGQGKSGLVEALFGRQFSAGSETRRPLMINAVNNPACDGAPRCVIKRDAASKKHDRDAEVAAEGLAAELAQRQEGGFNANPVVLQYEHAKVLNMTVIDTPGLVLHSSDPDASDALAREQLALALAAPTHRTIVVVRNGVDAKLNIGQGDYILELIRQVDPEFCRTIVVYTRLNTQLRAFQTNKDVNKYLTGGNPELKAFFVTLPPAALRDRLAAPERFQEKLGQCARRDLDLLEQLQFDKKFMRIIGANAFVKHLQATVWRSYQDSAPRLLRSLRVRKAEAEKALKEQVSQATALSANFFRLVASQYTTEFLHAVERLIAGTAEGNPALNGLSLEQERQQAGMESQWADVRGVPVDVDAEAWRIPHWQNKLYGGQQFERLLAEFKAVSDHTESSGASRDDTATAAGIPKMHNVPNYAWAASDLARSQAQEAFEPLIQQLSERAVFVMKRLSDIAEGMITEAHKKRAAAAPSQKLDASSIELYPYFMHFVKDQYHKFVEEVAKKCRERCNDEFYSTRTIYWDLMEAQAQQQQQGATLPEGENEVDTLTKKQFARIKERITRNVLLKFYNFFLVPMETTLWSEMQARVSELPDGALDDLFEVASVRESLKDTEAKLSGTIAELAEKEKEVLVAATTFSHPVAK